MSEAGDNQVATEVVIANGQEASAPKERIKRPSRPDDIAHKKQVEALQDVINKNKKRVEEIKQILDDRRNGRSASSSGQQGLKNKLAELRGQFQTVLKQKQALRAQLEAAAKTRENVRNSLKDLKANMKFTTIEQIDAAIQKLEDHVQHSSLSLNEEKKVLDDIRKLKASRSAVGEYSQKLETLAQDDTTRGELQTGIKTLDDELNKIKAEQEVLNKELADLREKEQEKGSDFPGLLAEREECREVCKQAYEKIKDLRAAHDGVWQEFKAQEKLWRAQQEEERSRRRAEAAAERAARDAERAARLAEMAPEPFDKEITACEQLTAYINRMVTAQAGPAEEESTKTSEVASLDGMKVFARTVAEEDSWLTGTGGGKKKGKGKKPAGAAPTASNKIVHSLDMLEAFTTLSISVPTSAAAMTDALSQVEAKKTEFLAKREEAKAAKEAAKEAGEASGSADAAAAPAAGDDEVEEGEIAAAPAASEGGKKKKGGKKAAQAPPKLDDVELWPAVGNGNGAVPASIDSSKPTAAEIAKGVANGAPKAVEA